MKMKLIFALVIMFVGALTITYASFPVQTASSNDVTMVDSADVLTSPAAIGGGKSQLVALLLCGFIGGLGVHRFYLGYTWQGIVQLLTAGGCGIWSLIDFIRIIMGTLEPKDGSYAKTL